MMNSQIIDAFFQVWIRLFLLPSAPVAILAWIFGRKRVRWTIADYAILVLPYTIWFFADEIWPRPKSLANFVEAFFLGVAVAVLVLLRLVVGRRLSDGVAAGGALAASCIVGIVLWLLVPGLPE